MLATIPTPPAIPLGVVLILLPIAAVLIAAGLKSGVVKIPITYIRPSAWAGWPEHPSEPMPRPFDWRHSVQSLRDLARPESYTMTLKRERREADEAAERLRRKRAAA